MIQSLKLNVFLILCGMLFGAFLTQRFTPEKVVTKNVEVIKTVEVTKEVAASGSFKKTKKKIKADGSSSESTLEGSLDIISLDSLMDNEEMLSTTIIEEGAKLRLHGTVEVNDLFKYSGYRLGASYSYYIGDIKFNELNKYNGFAVGLTVPLF